MPAIRVRMTPLFFGGSLSSWTFPASEAIQADSKRITTAE